MSPAVRRTLLAWLAAAGLALAFALYGAWGLVGRTYPGFLVQSLVYVSPYQLQPLAPGGLQPLDRVLRADGRPVTSARALFAEAARKAPGTPVAYEVLRAGRPTTVVVRTGTLAAGDVAQGLGALLLGALACMGIGLLAFWQRPELPAARALAGTLGWLGFALALYFDFNTGALAARPFLLAYPLTGAGVLALALTFPRPWGAVERRPWLVAGPWALGGAIALALQLLYTDAGPAVAEAWRYEPMFGLMIGLNVWTLLAIAGLVFSIVARFASAGRGTLVRHQAGAALAGAGLGFVPFGVWALQQALGLPEAEPLRVALLALLAFPGAIAYAMVRARLFDITLVVRNSLLYGLLSAILSVVYVGLVLVVRAASGQALHSASLPGDLFATAVVVALFAPVRDRLQHVIDRRLFRARYDAVQALEEASRSMTSLLDLDAIVDRVLASVEATLHPEHAGVLLHDHVGYVAYARRGAAAYAPLPASVETALRTDLGAVAARAALPVRRTHAVCDELAVLPAELAVPVSFRGGLSAVLVLGPKRSETPYSDSDLHLLGVLANQAAIAIENALAYRRIRAFNVELEDKVRQRTAQLEQAAVEVREAQQRALQSEKMAALGQLVAGVAHELNNPLAFVVGGVGLLARELPQLLELVAACEAGDEAAARELATRLEREGVREEIAAIVASCQQGATRMRDVIGHLKDFSRLDAFEPGDVDLGRCLAATLALVEPTYRKRVRFHAEVGAGPVVSGSESHLGQVFMNLLVNACQAVGDQGDVWVTLETAGAAARVTVRDNGVGMPPEVRQRVFEPFFTTKPVGVGTGLGLSICHGIIERHEGTIACSSEPGVGTVFTVTLPLKQGSLPLAHHPGC